MALAALHVTRRRVSMGEAGGAAEAAPANDEADATMYEVNSGAALEAAAMGDGGTTKATTIDIKFSRR